MSGRIERDQQVEQAKLFYQSLSLEDIWGKPRTPKVFKTSYVYDNHQTDEREFISPARELGIEGDFTIGRDQGYYTLTESLFTPQLTWWTPHRQERQILLGLFAGLSPNTPPRVLDVGFQTGFNSKLLALEGTIDLIGVDNEDDLSKKIPSLPNETYIKGDIWDLATEFSPAHTQYDQRRKKELLALLKAANEGGNKRDQIGLMTFLNAEIAELQALNQGRESFIDVVLCSFMDFTELTIPIRDGVLPKAIIYVRPKNSRSGRGDFYNELDTFGEASEANQDSFISFNPGRNYRTVARWDTLWAKDYPRFGGEPEEAEPTAEVIIQLRNDQLLPDLSFPDVSTYKFDREMDLLFGPNLESFLAGLHEARQQLQLS